MRFFKLDLLLHATLILTASASLACSSQGDECEANKSCASSGGGGSGGTGASGGTGGTGGAGGDGGGGCDLSKSPTEEACLVSDEFAVFVSPTGTAGAEGTKAAPVASITEAVTKAASSKLIIVCNGTYDEHVLVNAGAKIFGGFDCSTWASTSGTKPKIAPTDVGYALKIDSVSDEVIVENVEFVAKDGTALAVSSIAVFIASSAEVSLRDVTLEAGSGAKGADGVLTPFAYPTQGELNGADATTSTAGAKKTCCSNAGTPTSGGAGGTAGPQGGGAGQPSLGGGAGGDETKACNAEGKGGAGASGQEASPNIGAGATTLGTLDSSGWISSSGTAGGDGGPGQGGGGGASTAVGNGGGGGCGGCGGAGGPGGMGGGASIALLSFMSTVHLENCDLLAKNAGDGGKGASGQPAHTLFGFGGNGDNSGCGGGDGALGKPGGSGGGAAGGVSAAVASKGRPPTFTGGTKTVGTKGSAGVGGTPGANDGADGQAETELALP